MKKLAVLLLTVIGITGCTTTPISSDKATPMPKERMLAYTEPKPDYAKVQIIRDGGVLGSGCYFGVMYPNSLRQI